MIAVQSSAISSNPIHQQPVLIEQPCSINAESRTNEESDISLIDQSTVYYFKHLIRKYQKQMGDIQNTNVCSGGLQQYLIKQVEKNQRLQSEFTGQEQSKFESLPVDVKLHIFSYLSATDLCRVSSVCQSWYQITEDNILWMGLLDRDIASWSVIGHCTNPAMYREVQSDWSNKQIYLKCSPDVNKLMHQQNAVFHHISSFLRYFLPRHAPIFAMFGPGLETSTSGLVRRIIHESDLKTVGMFPGKYDGVGGGFTLRSPSGLQFNLSVLYSASQNVREKQGRDRNHGNQLIHEFKNTDSKTEKYELLAAVQDFCRTVDGFVYVVDASKDSSAVESGIDELMAIVCERWSATHVPVLVLSAVPQEDSARIPCCEVIERLKLSDLHRPWQVRNCAIDTRVGILEGFTWLAEQSQRR